MTFSIAFLSQTGNVCKTALAAAVGIEFMKLAEPIATIAIDTDKEHRAYGSLTSWAADRQQLQPLKDQLDVRPADNAEDIQRIVETTNADAYILDCPSRANTASALIAREVDMVVFPIVPGRKDLRLSIRTIHQMIELGVEPKRIAIVLTRCQSNFETEEMRRWLTQNSKYADRLTIIKTPLHDKIQYRTAIAKGLALTEAQPESLRTPARQIVEELAALLVTLNTTTSIEAAA